MTDCVRIIIILSSRVKTHGNCCSALSGGKPAIIGGWVVEGLGQFGSDRNASLQFCTSPPYTQLFRSLTSLQTLVIRSSYHRQRSSSYRSRISGGSSWYIIEKSRAQGPTDYIPRLTTHSTSHHTFLDDALATSNAPLPPLHHPIHNSHIDR